MHVLGAIQAVKALLRQRGKDGHVAELSKDFGGEGLGGGLSG
jgi:hypothetical protein